MGPDPAVAAVRSAVRKSLADIESGAVVLVACSGGADSIALAAATVFEARRGGWRVAGVTVDHGLQAGSSERADVVVAGLLMLGLDPVEVASVSVRGDGGPEAAARDARYAALDEVACRLRATAVLLGHTRDDQAETVLLGLARGSGARSLAGMPRHARAGGLYRRPLLGLDRVVTRAACAAQDLGIWDDPHNADPAYTRSRVRHRVLPLLEAELGPGVAAALARTADLLRDDADALDAWADRAYAECVARPNGAFGGADGLSGGTGGESGGTMGEARRPTDGSDGAAGSERAADTRPVALWVNRLQAVPPAVRRRVIRRAALWAGSPPTDLTAGHVAAADALVSAWRGQAWVDLPGGVNARRVGDQLRLATGGPSGDAGPGTFSSG